MWGRARWILVPLALLLGLAACAQDENGQETAAIDVAASEFQFEPDAWTAPADTDVAVSLSDEGALEHEWVVLEEGTRIASEGEFEEGLVAFELEADAGEETTGTMSLPSGTYQVICAVPGHFAAGMEGELTVR